MIRSLVFTLTLLCAGCSNPQPGPTPDPEPRPQPDAARAPDAAGGGSQSCARDADCTPNWSPNVNGCGPVERCMEGACITPPAMSGQANSETGRVVFEGPDGERQFKVELVDEPYETSRGLMCRDKMVADWGMLFIMPVRRVQSFWMKNTLIPLDMVFLDDDWTVVGVVANVPPLNLKGRSVGKPSRYVLELSAGAAALAGIDAGVQARFYAPSN